MSQSRYDRSYIGGFSLENVQLIQESAFDDHHLIV